MMNTNQNDKNGGGRLPVQFNEVPQPAIPTERQAAEMAVTQVDERAHDAPAPHLRRGQTSKSRIPLARISSFF